jgi:hypothetical protein
MPKSTTDFICGRWWSIAFTSGVNIEKRLFAMVATRRGPREGKSMLGMVFPRPLFFGDLISKKERREWAYFWGSVP